MHIQVTNAHPDYMDQPIILNTDNIVAVYQQEVAPKLSLTAIHCPPHGTWNVKESIEEVRSLLKAQVVSNTVVAKPKQSISVLEVTDTVKPGKKTPKDTV